MDARMARQLTGTPYGRQNSRDGVYKPSALVVELCLITVQILFGAGSVVGKLGIKDFNPVLFALIREGTAGPILLSFSFIYLARQRNRPDAYRITDEESLTQRVAEGGGYRMFPRVSHLWMFIAAGFFIFVNQLGFIVGEKLANATIGSAWQPSQPIMTATVAILLGWERPTILKTLGILVAFGGACFMVFFDSSSSSGSSPLVGNLLFFFNCAGTAGYVLLTKHIMKEYTSDYVAITVTGWSYIFASVFMTISGVSISCTQSALKFVCPSVDGESRPSCSAWDVPDSAIGPLLYWIFVQSVLCYMMLTWANQYANPSTTVAYTALQPLTSALLSVIVVKTAGKIGGLVLPGLNLLGGLGIVAGLILILYDNKQHASAQQRPSSGLDAKFLVEKRPAAAAAAEGRGVGSE